MATGRQLIEKVEALKLASLIGCSGAHQNDKGKWMPCATMEEMIEVSNRAEKYVPKKMKSDDEVAKEKVVKKRRRKTRRDDFEKLGESGISSIESIDAGLVSGPPGSMVVGKASQGPCWPGYVQAGMKPGKGGKMVPNCVPAEEKAANVGPEYVRETDPDVFLDPESARVRSRQLGCIGISRRISKNGRAVWMPCTNMSDYSRLAGTTPLGRKRKRENEQSAVRTVLTNMLKRRGIKSITEELGYKKR